MRRGERKDVLFIRNVPTDLKAFFKAYCARRGITMTEAIIEFMEEKVSKDNRRKA